MPHPGPLLLTCEHGGFRIPAELRSLMAGAEPLLRGHRGHDAGALELARQLRRRLGAPLVAATVTRLVVDLNRSRDNPAVLSEFSRRLDAAGRRRLMERYWSPHRERVDEALAAAGPGRVLHVGVHSFVGELDGKRREADVGLLYDPARPAERRLCAEWKGLLREVAPGLRVRRNYPFKGVSDGLTTHLRTRHPDGRYAGVELEVNRDFLADPVAWRELRAALAESLARLTLRS